MLYKELEELKKKLEQDKRTSLSRIRTDLSLDESITDEQLDAGLTSQRPQPKQDVSILKSIGGGLLRTLPGTAVRYGIGALTGEVPEPYIPQNTDEEAIVKMSELTGDVASMFIPGVGVGGRLYKALGGAKASTLLQQGLKAGARVTNKQAIVNGYKGSFLNDFIANKSKEFAKPYLKKTLPKRALYTATGMAGEGAMWGGLYGAKAQLNTNQDEGDAISKDLLSSIAIGAASGAVLSPVVGGTIKGLGKGFSAIRDKAKGFNLSDDTIRTIEKSYISAEKDVTKIKNLWNDKKHLVEKVTEIKENLPTASLKTKKYLNNLQSKLSKVDKELDDRLKYLGYPEQDIPMMTSPELRNFKGTVDLSRYDKAFYRTKEGFALQQQQKEVLDEMLKRAIPINLRKAGIDDILLKQEVSKRSPLANFLDKTTLVNDIYRQTGVGLNESLRNAIGLKNKMTHEKSGIIGFQNKIKAYDKNKKINKDDLYRIFTEEARPRTLEEKELLVQYKSITNELWKTLRENYKGELGQVKDGYFMRFLRKGIYGERSEQMRDKYLGRFNVPMVKKRLNKDVPELYGMLIEKDPIKMLDKYWQILERVKIKNTIGKNVDNSILSLEARGYQNYADKVKSMYMDMLGFPRAGTGGYNKIFVGDLANKSQDEIAGILGTLDIKPNIAERIKNELFDGMYKTVIGLSAPLQIAQRLQPYIVGVPELGGTKYIRRAAKLRKTAEGKRILKDVKDYLYPSDMYMAELPNNQAMLDTAGGLVGKAGKVIKALKYPGTKALGLFGKGDKINREIMYLAAREKLLKEGIGSKTLETLTQSQRRSVIRSGQKGIEQAADTYGRIMSDRVNFIYNAVNKPEVLRNQIGDLIPFTTWRRAQWNLFYNDLISNANAGKMITKRALIPAMYVGLANKITGYNFSSANPASGIFTLPMPMPMLLQMPSSKESYLEKVMKRVNPTYALGKRLADEDGRPGLARLLHFNKNF